MKTSRGLADAVLLLYEPYEHLREELLDLPSSWLTGAIVLGAHRPEPCCSPAQLLTHCDHPSGIRAVEQGNNCCVATTAIGETMLVLLGEWALPEVECRSDEGSVARVPTAQYPQLGAALISFHPQLGYAIARWPEPSVAVDIVTELERHPLDVHRLASRVPKVDHSCSAAACRFESLMLAAEAAVPTLSIGNALWDACLAAGLAS